MKSRKIYFLKKTKTLFCDYFTSTYVSFFGVSKAANPWSSSSSSSSSQLCTNWHWKHHHHRRRRHNWIAASRNKEQTTNKWRTHPPLHIMNGNKWQQADSVPSTQKRINFPLQWSEDDKWDNILLTSNKSEGILVHIREQKLSLSVTQWIRLHWMSLSTVCPSYPS